MPQGSSPMARGGGYLAFGLAGAGIVLALVVVSSSTLATRRGFTWTRGALEEGLRPPGIAPEAPVAEAVPGEVQAGLARIAPLGLL